MKEIKETLINLKNSLDKKLSPNKQKIIGTLSTVPLIAASNISGACAGGCPYGLINDPFPGQCSHYVDLNGDGICDLSQSAAATSTTTEPTTSTQSSESPTSTQNIDDSGSGANGIHNGNSDPSNASAIPDQGTGDLDSGSTVDGTDYHVLPLTLIIIGGYLFTYYLFSKGILKPQQHKRIWNLLLVGGYVGTGVTGVLLTLMVNLGIRTIYNPGITYWHVELAILMVIGTLIHIHIYRKPFKNMFKVLFGFKSMSNKNNATEYLKISK